MGLPEIYADLQAAARAGSLTGDAPKGLADLLTSLNTPALPVTRGQATLAGDSARLSGNTTFLNSDWSLDLVARDANNAQHPNRADLQVTLTLDIQPLPWTFGQAFGAGLPLSRRSGTGGGLVLGPSVVAPLVLEAPILSAANKPDGGYLLPRLQGSLPLDGRVDAPGSDVLARYGAFLGTPLYVDGTINLADPELIALDLAAVSPGAQLSIGALTVSEVGIRLTTTYPDPSFLPEPDAARSAALLFAKVTLPTVPTRIVDISGPLLIGDHVWPLQIDFEDPLDLEGGISALLALAGVSDAGDFALPPGIAPINEFGLSDLGFGILPPARGGPGLRYASIGIASRRPWDPPVAYLTINEVGTRWSFAFGGPRTLVTGSVYGTMTFGQKPASSLGAAPPFLARPRLDQLADSGEVGSNIVVTVRLDLPDLAFTAYTEEPFDIPISRAFAAFFGGTVPNLDLTVQELVINASLTRKEFGASLTVGGDWAVTAGLVTFRLIALELQVLVSQNAVTGRIQGQASIDVPNAAPIELLAAAAYPGTGAWDFEAALMGTLNLAQLAYGLIGTPPPDWVNQVAVELTNLALRYSTGPGNPYSAEGTLRLVVSVLGFDMSLEMTAQVERRLRAGPSDEALAVAVRGLPTADADTVVSAQLSGTFSVNGFSVRAAVSMQDAGRTYTFVIGYRGLALTATTSWDSTGGTRHQILTLRLSGATLGSVVEYLVGLANPNANYRLEPPWDFLNTIDLGGFALVIDPTVQTVALTYDLKLDLGFVSIDQIGVRLERSSGTPTVNFVLVAKMLGDNAAQTRTWDAVNQSPPAVPGLGQRLFTLRYLGLGQHVSPKNLTQYRSITDVVDALVKAMRPVNDPRKVPIDPATMAFDPSSQWLFGIDATVMDTVSVKMVMHDPDLYGVVIALSGPQAQSLAGFSLELLYKKVTDDIGVFHARLQIPDAFRKLQFGAVSVTLGIITLDIYTNGNFRVDLGFPQNRDFSVSFAVEAGLFNGRGGIYFGLLNGSTSDRVPRITNGTFSPVIELGIGLSVGVGRTFQKGPLDAGLYVNLVVIFEGALGWFHPDQAGSGTELYYWCRGSVGIVGKIYGSVDFKVISVSVSIEVSAIATLEMAAYKASVVELSLNVRANASVKIVFFRVSFSFSLELRTSFNIGSDSTPPWRLASGQAARSRRGVLSLTSSLRARTGGALADRYRLHFDPDARVFPNGEVHEATIKLVPAYTVAEVPVNWSGDGVVPDNPAPAYRLVIMLIADNAVPWSAVTIADTHRVDVSRHPRASRAADTSFNQIAEGMLRWALDALGVHSPTAVVTLAELQDLVEQLAMVESANTGFTWDNLEGFLTHNLHLVVSGTPTGDGADPISGTPFPMIPVLQWTSPDLPDPAERQRQFWDYQPVDATYEAEALAYFQKLDPRPPEDRPSAALRLAAAAEKAESMATFVLRDYFRLVARAATQEAANLLSAFPHTVVSTDSLRSIADSFPTTTVDYVVVPDDSVEQVAEHLGLSAAELLARNPDFAALLSAAQPGQELAVTVGVTAPSIALGNPDWPVTEGATVHLGDLAIQIPAQATLGSLAARFGVEAARWMAEAGIDRDPTLLRPGAVVALPGYVDPNPTGLSVDEAAAVFFIRLGRTRPVDVPLVAWYAEAIDRLNLPETGDAAPSVPALSVPALSVPAAYLSTDTRTWTTLPGDTIDDVAAYLALVQNVVAGSDFDIWQAQVRAANNPAPPAGIALPSDAAAVIAAGDTLARLRARLLLDGAPQLFSGYVEGAQILQPLVSVTVTGAVVRAAAGLTILTLAQTFDLALEDLAGRMAADPGVLALDGTRRLVVPEVPAIGLAVLTEALHDGQTMATISGQVARFMLYGLRLPAPEFDGETYHATGPMTGAYELIGQQVTGPAPTTPTNPGAEPRSEPEPAVVTITVDNGHAADWLRFAESVVLGPDDDAEALRVRNPGLPNASSVAGIIALGDAIDSAMISITESDLVANYPATGLAPAFRARPAPLALFHELGVRYPLTQVIPWQTTDGPTLPVPTPASASPSLWLLSADVMAKAGAGQSASRFSLEQATPQAGPKGPTSEVSGYAWATLVRFGVRRIPGLAGTVEVLGADGAHRQRIALVLEYLGTLSDRPARAAAMPPRPPGEHAWLKLLWQLPPTPGQRPGLTSLPLAASATWIVQTNLSTETRSGSPAAVASADPTAGRHFASIADTERFLTLLWECSVVGGGGYWMQFRGDAGDVAESIFDQDGLAQLSLLIQMESQSTTNATEGWPVRHLLAFNNCAAVGDGLDPASVAVAARPTDPAEVRREATVEPGQVGFTASLTNPGPDPATAEGRLSQLYSLLGYRLADTVSFESSTEGHPVGPQTVASHDEDGLAVLAEADEAEWNLSRVIDIATFARDHLPALPSGPPPLRDPYAGIATGGSGSAVALWFQDVFGNASADASDSAAGVSLPVGYTDPMIGVNGWPSTTTSFGVEPADDAARVAVTVSFQSVAYQPAAAESGAESATKAARDRDLLAAVLYQVMQPDVHATVMTSLENAPGQDPTRLPVDMDTLRRYALGAHALLASVASLEPARADSTKTPTLDALCAWHGIDYDSLAGANGAAAIDSLVAPPVLQIPLGAAFRTGDTVAALCHAYSPEPDPAVVLTDQDNVGLPLMVGVQLSIPPFEATVGDDQPSASILAAGLHCSLDRLVRANQDRPSLLTPDFVFECNGVKVGIAPTPPQSDATLAGVASTFQSLGVPLDAATVAALNGETPGMFRRHAVLTVDGYIVEAGDTLATNGAHLSPAQLAGRNGNTVDLFPPGTPLFLTTRAQPVTPGDTLDYFAAYNGVAPSALLRHNGPAPLVAQSPPVVPGTWAWPDDPYDLRVPYTLRPGDTLEGVAARCASGGLGSAAVALAEINEAMPGTIAAGVTISVGLQTVTTAQAESFQGVCDLFAPPARLEDLVAAIDKTPGVLAPGALFVCPPGVLPPALPDLAGTTPADAAVRFGLAPVSLLAANAGTPGIVLDGQMLLAWTDRPDAPAPVETTTAGDTLTAVVERFRRRDVSTSIDTVVAANSTVGFLRPGALVLLAPAAAHLDAPIGTASPDGVRWSFPGPVFPVHVTLELARDQALVNPDLIDSATRAGAVVPAGRSADAAHGGPLSLAAFAAQVQAAVPVLRVATGQVLAEESDPIGTDVWAMVFDHDAVSRVRVYPPLTLPGVATPQPRTFALRPLANTLIARQGVFTQGFDVATGTLVGGDTRSYSGIDLEVWARSFLADTELLLSPAYVRGAYGLNRPALDSIAEDKKALAAAVAAGLDYVLAGEAPAGVSDTKRAAAVEALRQRLLVSLTQGYDTSAVIQYDTDVVSSWATPYARLSGNPVVTFASTDERLKTASITNAKVSLATGPSQITMLVSVPDVAAHAELDVALAFRVVELEFAISPEIDGYDKSDWLTFLTPLDNGSPAAIDINLGSPRIPLPLRAYPPLPLLVDHRAVVPTTAAVLDDALHWRYQFALQHQSAEQDSIGFQVTFNQAAGAGVRGGADDDLFAALAQYNEVRTPMLGLLAGLADWEEAPPERQAVLAATLGTFASLAHAMALGWQGHWNPRAAAPQAEDADVTSGGPVLDVYDFAVELAATTSAEWYTSLKLERTAVAGPGAVGWPEVSCITSDGTRYPLGQAPPEACDCGDPYRCRCYLFPPDSKVAAFTSLTFEFTMPPVHIARYQNAGAATWVTRNANLLGAGGPATTPEFVYRTPTLSYPTAVVPFIDITGLIVIGAWADHPLEATFESIFDGDSGGRTVAVGARYGYTLVAGDPPIEALLPVTQSTVGTYEGTTIATLSSFLNQWKDDNNPAPEGGAWAFRVSLYSSLDPALQRPVLQLKRLSSSLQRI